MLIQVVDGSGKPIIEEPELFANSREGHFSVEQLITWMPLNRTDFEPFAKCLQEIEANPEIPVFVLPTDLDFQIPDFYTYNTKADQRLFNRFQVCMWLVHDPAFCKPIHIAEVGSASEIRLLSGLGPQMRSVTIKMPSPMCDDETRWLLEMYYAAGDVEAAEQLLSVSW